MMYCAWGDTLPEEIMGLKLDREHAMKYFQDLRIVGIRAHFWP